jgi:putative sterol carrier protein
VATVSEITTRLSAALQSGEGLGKSLKIDFKGDGFIHVDGTVVTNADASADCTVLVSLDDLTAMAKGELDPMSAMMRGRLKINGDMSVALKLQSMLRRGG